MPIVDYEHTLRGEILTRLIRAGAFRDSSISRGEPRYEGVRVRQERDD